MTQVLTPPLYVDISLIFKMKLSGGLASTFAKEIWNSTGALSVAELFSMLSSFANPHSCSSCSCSRKKKPVIATSHSSSELASASDGRIGSCAYEGEGESERWRNELLPRSGGRPACLQVAYRPTDRPTNKSGKSKNGSPPPPPPSPPSFST